MSNDKQDARCVSRSILATPETKLSLNMKFTLIYSRPDGTERAENYNGSKLFNPDGVSPITAINLDEAEEWGKRIIEFFNDTLKKGEQPRTFERVEIGNFARKFNREVQVE